MNPQLRPLIQRHLDEIAKTLQELTTLIDWKDISVETELKAFKCKLLEHGIDHPPLGDYECVHLYRWITMQGYPSIVIIQKEKHGLRRFFAHEIMDLDNDRLDCLEKELQDYLGLIRTTKGWRKLRPNWPKPAHQVPNDLTDLLKEDL